MRTADRPVPTLPVAWRKPSNPSVANWRMWPVVAIAQIAPYLWDDEAALWDSDIELVWDVPYTDWAEATCDVMGLQTETGNPDDKGLFDAGSCTLTIYNGTGLWSQFRLDGTNAQSGPGSELAVWATDGINAWWLFDGLISRWDERTGDIIEIEAFDRFSDLNQSIGTFTPGANGDRPGTRLEAILAAIGRSAIPHNFATGTVTLTAQATDQSVLEEMQEVQTSDGGIIYADVDGTLRTYDRTWRSGRDNQPSVPIVSDNVCTAPVVIWDAVLTTNDIGLADMVVVENVAKLHSQAAAVPAPRTFVLSFTDLQYTTQTEGDILAQLILDGQKTARVQLDEFGLYLHDTEQSLWGCVDWRVLDRMRFLHDSKVVGGTVRVDVGALIMAIAHDITPEGWVMSVRGSKAQTFTEPVIWNTAYYAWNDTTVGWGY